MPKAVLPTNFKDDIINTSMGGKRRYKMINNSDGTISLEDATVYDQVGSTFGSGQLNSTNSAVNGSADAAKIIDSLADVAANTQPGMMAGALAVKAVNQNLGIQFRSVRPYVQCKLQIPLAAYATINITKDISNFGFAEPPIALLSSTYLCSSTVRLITTSILEVTISNFLNYASADCFASYTLLEIKKN